MPRPQLAPVQLYHMHPSAPSNLAPYTAPPMTLAPVTALPAAPQPAAAQPVTTVQQVAEVQQVPVAQHDIEDLVKHDPLFAQGLQSQRRQQLGLDKPQILEFLSKTNLISLGSYCAVANTFESLGLRDAAGPFDWMRSDCTGITHLVENGFEDFLEWEGTSHKIGSLDVFPMKWGGSFWHHDIRDEKVRETFRRRAQRFLDTKNDNLLFIRVVNGTQELSHIKALHQALSKRYGEVSRVRLLVLVDLQDYEQDVVTQELGRDIIFSCVHHQSWEGPLNGSPEEQARQRLHVASEAYSQALSRALSIWCNCGSFVSWPSVAAFTQYLVPWLGTDPRRDSFQPSRLSPRRVAVAATATAAVTLNAATLMTRQHLGAAAVGYPFYQTKPLADENTIIRL